MACVLPELTLCIIHRPPLDISCVLLAQWTCCTYHSSPWVELSVLEVMQHCLGNPVGGRHNAICWLTALVFLSWKVQDRLADEQFI